MARFWMSWWGGDGDDCRPVKTEGVPPWARSATRDGVSPPHAICAVVDAESEDAAWAIVRAFWPEAERRFIEPKTDGWLPEGDRFAVITKAICAAQSGA